MSQGNPPKPPAEEPLIEPSKVPMALAGAFGLMFASSSFLGLLTVALPKLSADLNGLALYSWAVSAPALTGAIATLIFGKLGDMYGRRVIALFCMVLSTVSIAFLGFAQTMEQWIIARAILGVGIGAAWPLAFALIGDIFGPINRSKWGGLLNIASAIPALIAPTIGGILIDGLGWRYIFYILTPIMLIGLALLYLGTPATNKRASHTIDYVGAGMLILAMSTMLFGFSWGGTLYPWDSPIIIGLLSGSVVVWAIFIWYERRVPEPMLSPDILTNRVFMTASIAGMAAMMGLQAIVVYLPLMMQGVQNLSGALSGQAMTPYQVIMRVMGIFAGLAMARWKKYKWMYLVCYTLLVIGVFAQSLLEPDTPVIFDFFVTTVCGLGLGTIPMVSTLVCQNSLPKRMIGQATSGMYFLVFIGQTMAPAILGAVVTAKYLTVLKTSLPTAAGQVLDKATLASLDNPRILLNAGAMTALQKTFTAVGANGQAVFDQTVIAVRTALQQGLYDVFIAGTIGCMISLLLIITIPEIPLADAAEKKQMSEVRRPREFVG